MNKDFLATHTITTEGENGKRNYYHVMEVEGSLYTRAEWDAADNSDWFFNDNRELLFQGQVAPTGARYVWIKRKPGRPPNALLGITAEAWARALGEESPAALLRAQRAISGARKPTPQELVQVADATGVDLAELVRAVAALSPGS